MPNAVVVALVSSWPQMEICSPGRGQCEISHLRTQMRRSWRIYEPPCFEGDPHSVIEG